MTDITARKIDRGQSLLKEEPQTLRKLFLRAFADHKKDDALNFRTTSGWEKISSCDMAERIENVAAGLTSLGIKKGDRTAILAANSPDWTIADAGCQFAGIIDVPIYTTLAPSSVKYILNDAGVKLLFVDDQEAYDRIKDEIADVTSLEKVVSFDNKAEIPNAMTLAELESAGKEYRKENQAELDAAGEAVTKDDIATLIYTSGTTGEPKGVMLTHTNIVSNVIDAGERYGFTPADRPLSVLPLSHVFERSAMYLYILNGMSVHYAESIDKVPDNLAEVKPTLFVGVPRIFEKVYAKAKLSAVQAGGLKATIFEWAIATAIAYASQVESGKSVGAFLKLKHSIADKLVYSKLRKFFGGNLRFCITGGAALADDIFLIFTGAGIKIMQGYGLTETSPVISSNNPSAVKLGSVGKPISNMQARIADDGEVEAFGPGVMLGYYNKPDATRDAFTDDGWFKTGDIGRIDDEGFLFITDRKKELFKTSGGKYIAPSPIEQMIRGSRFVNQVVLIGNGRKFASALIVPNFEQLKEYAKVKGLKLSTPADFCSDEKIIDLLERKVAERTKGLSRFETVKKIALLENEMTVETGELTPTLKVKRRVVDEKYKDVIDKFYSEDQ